MPRGRHRVLGVVPGARAVPPTRRLPRFPGEGLRLVTDESASLGWYPAPMVNQTPPGSLLARVVGRNLHLVELFPCSRTTITTAAQGAIVIMRGLPIAGMTLANPPDDV